MGVLNRVFIVVSLLEILFLVSAWSLRHAAKLKLPSFMWIEEHSSEDGASFLNIRFPDGKWDDFAILRKKENESCVLVGQLYHEKNVSVKIEGGCDPAKTFKIFFNSKRLPYSIFIVDEDKVTPILESLDFDDEISQTVSSTHFHSNSVQLPTEVFEIRIKAFYDESFKKKFESFSKTLIEKIFDLAQEVFEWPTLAAEFKFKLNLFGIEEVPHKINADDSYLKTMADLYTNATADAFVFFADGQDDDEEKTGITYNTGLCSSNYKNRAAIVEWSLSLSVTAKTLVHEIGHLLGMKHDFHIVNGKYYSRNDPRGINCTSIGGVMDYTTERNIWSQCSIQDLFKYYDKVIRQSTDSKFCLTPVAVDGMWEEWSDFSKCSVSCGGSGTITRYRECNNPAPLNNGRFCTGVGTETKACNMGQCHGDLHRAASEGNLDIVKDIISNKGGDIEERDDKGMTALYLAVSNGKLNVVKFLIEKGADMDERSPWDRTLLHAAAEKGYLDIVKFLIEKGADMEETGPGEHTLLHVAAEKGYLDIVKFLIENGSLIEARDQYLSTPLHFAAQYGHLDVVKFLIENGSLIEARCSLLDTPLHFAASNGHLDVIKFLIENGANVERKNKSNKTSLHLAAESGSVDVVKFLLDKGANIEAKQYEGLTPLAVAALWGKLEVVKFLIEKNADIKAKDNEGNTLLHNSCKYQFIETQVVKFLIEAGANIEAKNNNGWTPLHFASHKGNLNCVIFLIKNGADVGARDKNGKTPLDLATAENKYNVVKFLSKKQVI